MAYVRAYSPGDAQILAPLLREADRREIQASSGRPEADVLEEGAELSVPSCSIIDDTDTVVGMFGVVPYYDFGKVWLMGSDALVRPPTSRQLLKECKTWLSGLERVGFNGHRYRSLCNVIDARNTLHIRWLKWMGFTFIRTIPDYGVEKRPFLEFIKLCANQ